MEYAQLSRSFGFITQEMKGAEAAFIQEKVAGGSPVGQWINGTFFIHYDSSRDAQRLGRWKSLMVEGAASFRVPDIASKARMLEYFGLGDLDYLVCDNHFIAFPQNAQRILREIEKVVRALNEAGEKNENVSAVSTPPFPEELRSIVRDEAYLDNIWGKLLTYHGKYSEAGEVYRKAVERMNEFGEAYSNLGTLLWKLGKQREALVLFAESVLKNPYGVTGQLNFFDAGYELEEFGAMSRVIEEVVQNAPECAEYYHHLAICYARTNRSEDALQILKTILEKNPDDEEARLLLQGIQTRLEVPAEVGIQ